MTIHKSPPSTSGVMPCCGKTPFEVSRKDRITLLNSEVECKRFKHNQLAKNCLLRVGSVSMTGQRCSVSTCINHFKTVDRVNKQEDTKSEISKDSHLISFDYSCANEVCTNSRQTVTVESVIHGTHYFKNHPYCLFCHCELEIIPGSERIHPKG